MKICTTVFVILLVCICVVQAYDVGWQLGEIAHNRCKQNKDARRIRKGFCGTFQEIVEDVYDEQGMTLQLAFENKHSDAEQVFKRDAFRKSAELMIDSFLNWVAKRSVSDMERVKGEFIQRFFKWFAEVLKEVDKPGSGLQSWDFLNEMPNPLDMQHQHPA